MRTTLMLGIGLILGGGLTMLYARPIHRWIMSLTTPAKVLVGVVFLLIWIGLVLTVLWAPAHAVCPYDGPELECPQA